MNNVELQTLVGGALQEKFAKSFEKVIENLIDPNTSYKIKRGITIKLSFVQNEKRDDVHVDIDVVEKLAPQASLCTSFSIGKDLRKGSLYAKEYGKDIPGQLTFSDYENVEDRVVDTTTGEIMEEETVVDFRKAAK